MKKVKSLPKNIAIHPEALISHSRIIKNHKTKKKPFKHKNQKNRKLKTTPNFFPYGAAIGSQKGPYRGSKGPLERLPVLFSG